WFAVERHLEPLDQHGLQHFQKLLFGSLGRILRLGLDVEALVAACNPVRAAPDHVHGLDFPGDAHQVTEPGIADHTAAERGCVGYLPRRVDRIDAVAAAVDAAHAGRAGFD